MALNRAFANARKNSYPVASGVVSGDPVIVGADLPGVALTDYDVDTGEASIDTGGAYWLDVEGGPDAGDVLYFHTGTPPTINATSSGGKRFGYAMQTVATGIATNIPVKIGY